MKIHKPDIVRRAYIEARLETFNWSNADLHRHMVQKMVGWIEAGVYGKGDWPLDFGVYPEELVSRQEVRPDQVFPKQKKTFPKQTAREVGNAMADNCFEITMCPKCGVTLHGSPKWVALKLSQPCEKHVGNRGNEYDWE